jgi:DNA topoisomerase I
MGEGKEAKRASIPKDMPELDLDWAVKLLSLPRTSARIPKRRGSRQHIGRYGPYLAHDGKYAKLQEHREVFETGMNSRSPSWPKRRTAGAGRARRGGTAQDLWRAP